MTALSAPGADRPQWIWRNGGLVAWNQATVHVNAVGHASVSSVFEGIKAYRSPDGQALYVFRLDEHLRRLFSSARVCRLTLPYDLAALRSAVLALLQANQYDQDVYLRPWAFPAGIVHEQIVPADVTCEVVVDSWPFTTGLGTPRGCRAAVSSWQRISDTSMPPRVKAFSNYHNARLATMEARRNGYDWPILLNDQHKVSEGAGACLAIVRDGVLVTPALSSSVLESITRDTVLTLCRDMGMPVAERDIDRSELYLADEIFFMGTGWEILPVTEVDGLTVGASETGPVTEQVSSAYAQVVRGEISRYHHWLTEVTVPARH
jgi:branched-chain amino acid aminotransferase